MEPIAASLEINKLIRIIRLARDTGYIRKPDGKWVDIMTPQAFQIVLEIAQRPGITMNQLMDATGISLGSVSRNLMALGELHRADMPGLGLVETVDDPREWRRKLAFLTIKGRNFASEIVSVQLGRRVMVKFPMAYEFMSRSIDAEKLSE